MKKEEKLLRALGGVGDDLIARAAQPVKKQSAVWVKWAALAACCSLAIGAAALGLRSRSADKAEPAVMAYDMEAEAAADAAPEESAPQMAAAEYAAAGAPTPTSKAAVSNSLSEMPDNWMVFDGGVYERVTDDEDLMLRLKSETSGYQKGEYLGDVKLSPWPGNVTGRAVYAVTFEGGVLNDYSDSDYVAVDIGTLEQALALYRYVSVEPDLEQPFTAYIPDDGSEQIEIYTADRQTYLTSIPYETLGVLRDYGAGWTDGVEFYGGVIGRSFAWILVSCPSESGGMVQNFCVSRNGGEVWDISDFSALPSGTVTGAGFANDEVGFISYRAEEIGAPVIYRTIDGGASWQQLELPVPENYANCRIDAGTPTFSGENGVYPLTLYDADSDEPFATGSMITRDGGISWIWE